MGRATSSVEIGSTNVPSRLIPSKNSKWKKTQGGVDRRKATLVGLVNQIFFPPLSSISMGKKTVGSGMLVEKKIAGVEPN